MTGTVVAIEPQPGATGQRAVRPRRLAGGVAALIVLLVALGAVLAQQSPDPSGVDAPPAEYSAGRAMVNVNAVAAGPRPTGSAQLAQVRQYLLDTLGGLGLNATTTTRTACRDQVGAEAACGEVTNIQAVLPGRQRGSAVVLVCHYDSNPGGPGAADDGFGISTLLEVARALKAGPQLENDVVLLFTDGEEAGLVGSRAAVDAGTLPDPARSVVLNLEARGVAGPAVMFESTTNNLGVVTALQDNPADATSLSAVVYGFLGSDTDFSEFRAAGLTGMGFAVVGGSAHYDTALDTIPNADPSGLQDLGNAVLAATRNLAGEDLGELVGSGPATYFPLFGWLVVYPEFLSTVLAALALLAFAGAVWMARRRGMARLSAIGATCGGLLAAVVIAAGVGLLVWELILLVRPDYIGFLSGNPFQAGFADAGASVIALAIAVMWWAIARRHTKPVETAAAVTGLFTILCVAAVVFMPGGSYLATWPALAGAVAIMVAVRLPAESPWYPVLWALPAAVAVALVLPVALLLFPVVGLAMVAAPMLLVTLLAAAAIAGLSMPRLRRRVTSIVSVVLVLAGTALIGTGLAVDEADAKHPKEISIIYGLDADSGQASWLSPYPVEDPFVDHYVGQERQPWSDRFPLLYSPGYRSGKASSVTVATPSAQLIDSSPTDGGRQLRLRLTASQPGATALAGYVDTTNNRVLKAEVNGRGVSGGTNHDATHGWGWGFTFAGAAADGFDLTLTVSGTGPVRLKLLAQSPGLPTAAMDRPMPDTVTGASFPSVQTLAARTVTY